MKRNKNMKASHKIVWVTVLTAFLGNALYADVMGASINRIDYHGKDNGPVEIAGTANMWGSAKPLVVTVERICTTDFPIAYYSTPTDNMGNFSVYLPATVRAECRFHITSLMPTTIQ